MRVQGERSLSTTPTLEATLTEKEERIWESWVHRGVGRWGAGSRHRALQQADAVLSAAQPQPTD